MIEITGFGDPIGMMGARVSPCHDKCQADYNCEGHCVNDDLTHQTHIDDFSAKYWHYNNL